MSLLNHIYVDIIGKQDVCRFTWPDSDDSKGLTQKNEWTSHFTSLDITNGNDIKLMSDHVAYLPSEIPFGKLLIRFGLFYDRNEWWLSNFFVKDIDWVRITMFLLLRMYTEFLKLWCFPNVNVINLSVIENKEIPRVV